MDKKMSLEKYMKIRLMTFGAAFLIFTVLDVISFKFSFNSDMLIPFLGGIGIVFIVFLVILVWIAVKEKRYWQYKYMNQLKGVLKAVKIFSAIAIAVVLVSMAMKVNTSVSILVADGFLLMIFVKECYYFKLVKKYNMEDFETREEFEEKYQL